MRTFRFEAGYYEWHLTDAQCGELLLNIIDPVECCYNCYDEPLDRHEIEEWCLEELEIAEQYYNRREDYNGALLSKDSALSKEEMEAAAKLMADVLLTITSSNNGRRNNHVHRSRLQHRERTEGNGAIHHRQHREFRD